MALPTRGPRTQIQPPVDRHQLQNLLPQPAAFQKACSSLWSSLTNQGAGTRCKKMTIQQPAGPACPQQARLCPETSRTPALPIIGPTQASGHPTPHIQLCQEPAPPANDLTPALGSLGNQTPGPGAVCEQSSTNPRTWLQPPVSGQQPQSLRDPDSAHQ